MHRITFGIAILFSTTAKQKEDSTNHTDSLIKRSENERNTMSEKKQRDELHDFLKAMTDRAIESHMEHETNGIMTSVTFVPDGKGGATAQFDVHSENTEPRTTTPSMQEWMEERLQACETEEEEGKKKTCGKCNVNLQECGFCNETPCVITGCYDMLCQLGDSKQSIGMSNREIRFELYREATRFLHGFLGKGNRRQLPLCVIGEIHDLYPAEKGTKYTGFKATGHG